MRLDKGIWDLSGIFLVTVYESTMILINISMKKDTRYFESIKNDQTGPTMKFSEKYIEKD